MSDVRQLELRDPPGWGDIRKWLKESFEGAEWEDDDSSIDFDDTPIDQILSPVFDLFDLRLSEALNRLGYSSETICDFRENRFVLASAVEGPKVPVGYTVSIDPENQHPPVCQPESGHDLSEIT